MLLNVLTNKNKQMFFFCFWTDGYFILQTEFKNVKFEADVFSCRTEIRKFSVNKFVAIDKRNTKKY